MESVDNGQHWTISTGASLGVPTQLAWSKLTSGMQQLVKERPADPIAFLIDYLGKHGMTVFSAYRVVLGVCILLFLA